MKMWSRRIPAGSDETESGTLLDSLSSLHDELGQVSIQALNTVPVLENDRPSVPVLPAGERDDARRGRADGRSDASANIDAGVNVAPFPRRVSCSKAGTDGSPHRPLQLQRAERVGIAAEARSLRRSPSSEGDTGHDRRETYHSPARHRCKVHTHSDALKPASAVPVRF